MWFNYRRTPLGTVIRDSMATILGVYSCRDSAEEEFKKLRDSISGELKIIDIDSSESYEILVRLDPDIVDIVRSHRNKYALIVFWTSNEP